MLAARRRKRLLHKDSQSFAYLVEQAFGLRQLKRCLSLLADWRAPRRSACEKRVPSRCSWTSTELLRLIQDDLCAVAMNSAVRVALMRLARNPGVRVCIISGRRLADLRERVGVTGLDYLGVHGSDAPGAGFPLDVAKTVGEVRRELASRLNGSQPYPDRRQGRRLLVVDITGGRGPQRRSAHAREVLDPKCRGEGHAGALRVVPGDRVWEVLPREIRGKGHAARKEWRRRSGRGAAHLHRQRRHRRSGLRRLASGLTARVGGTREPEPAMFCGIPARSPAFSETLGERKRDCRCSVPERWSIMHVQRSGSVPGVYSLRRGILTALGCFALALCLACSPAWAQQTSGQQTPGQPHVDPRQSGQGQTRCSRSNGNSAMPRRGHLSGVSRGAEVPRERDQFPLAWC